MKKMIFATLALMIVANAEYLRNDSTEIVLDTRTNLMWQDNEDTITNNDMNWTAAIDYCENLTLAGFDDWRMPNFNEYDSIIDTQRHVPAVNPAFHNVVTGEDQKYWTSTTYMYDTNVAWTLQTRNGWNFQSPKNENDGTIFVRCVRSEN